MTEQRRGAPPQLMFDDGSRAMAENSTDTLPASKKVSSPRGDMELEEFYEIERITHQLAELSRSSSDSSSTSSPTMHIALQFPDDLLDDSPEVCWSLEERLSSRLPTPPLVFCLGDTTVGSCCPDEVAALHLQADVLVHYGHACLSPTGTLPVIYSFGQRQLDVSSAVDAIMGAHREEAYPRRILLLYEVSYHRSIESLQTQLSESGDILVVAGNLPELASKPERRAHSNTASRPAQTTNACKDSCGCTFQKEPAIESSTKVSNESSHQPLVVGGLELPKSIQRWEQLSEFTLVYVGDCEGTSQRQYSNIMLQLLSLPSQLAGFWTYNPIIQSLSTEVPRNIQKQLNRRFFLTQKARDAEVLGILVSNLSQKHLVDVVKAIKAKIQDAGKSSYSFAVGKINPAKLANFAEIQCFILVACTEHSLLHDEREYHIPVVTPMELSIALGILEWGKQPYSFDCQDMLLSRDVTTGNLHQAEGDDDSSHDAPYYSMVTGTYIRRMGTEKSDSLDLEALPGKGQLAALNTTAAQFLGSREYQGLVNNIGDSTPQVATLGQKGIASGYSNDKKC